MTESSTGLPGSTPPIARALGEDFRLLHPTVRRHYSETYVTVTGVMDSVYVSPAIRPIAWLSHRLFGAPVPHGGADVEITVHSSVDGSGTMHWLRTFLRNDSFPRDVNFESHVAFGGDHRVVESVRFGLGAESDLRVDDSGRLIYEIRRYMIRIPLLGQMVKFPTWLSPFGGSRTTESGEDETAFTVEFDMYHPIFGRTVGYKGRCRLQ